MTAIRILKAAREDLLDGYEFYQRQAPGIGRYFLDTLYSDIESLQISAGVHEQWFDGYYRLHSRRFPFAIYYRVTDEEIHVYAILDSRRKPDAIKQRLAAHRDQ